MNMNITATKPVFTLFLSLYLLFLVTHFPSHNNGVHCYPQNNKKVVNLKDFQWKIHPSSSQSRTISQKSRITKNGVTILEMKHRGSEKITTLDHWIKNLKKQLVVDDLRVKSLQSQFMSTTNNASDYYSTKSKTQIPLISGIKLQILNYIVTVQLGGRNMTVIVDTGSDLTWVQCQPCKSCYDQKEPLFNPSQSKTYQTVPCNSATCQSLQFATGYPATCAGPACGYDVSYGDGSRTRGDLGRDRLGLGSTPVDGFVFGCGRINKGLFGGASGLMGLGKSELSLISQSSSIFGGVFSYCLPPAEPGASGSLIMGFDSSAYRNSTPISYTGMVPNPQLPTFYFLNLTGVSLGDVDVPMASASSSILIDSGTVITRLAPSIYKAVKAEFVKQFSGFAPAPGFSILDTCFDLSGYDQVSVPAMRMSFDGGAELDIDVTGMLYMVKNDASQVCLALASLSYEYEIGIIGNYQQKNQRVVYDTKQARLGFAGETCSFV